MARRDSAKVDRSIDHSEVLHPCLRVGLGLQTLREQLDEHRRLACLVPHLRDDSTRRRRLVPVGPADEPVGRLGPRQCLDQAVPDRGSTAIEQKRLVAVEQIVMDRGPLRNEGGQLFADRPGLPFLGAKRHDHGDEADLHAQPKSTGDRQRRRRPQPHDRREPAGVPRMPDEGRESGDGRRQREAVPGRVLVGQHPEAERRPKPAVHRDQQSPARHVEPGPEAGAQSE